ncbi:MAG: EF-P lysine aminoacylase GenX [Saccharospirillum sp.]|nr:EF-P lysine aminoacylase GenX [Saccharospirillum sp.]
MVPWQPSASLPILRRRAQFLADIRAFFAERDVMEVDTPLMSSFGVTDLHLENFRTEDGRFLQTSPEYAMKRLLAAGSGDIYQLSHVFRKDETSKRHNAEFTLLEWYRLGWNDRALMDEVAQLCRQLAGRPDLKSESLSYVQAFSLANLPDPHTSSLALLQQVAAERLACETERWRRDDCLDGLMAVVVEPLLPPDQLTFVTLYPASQAALARQEAYGGVHLARRFELYWQGMELANGYWELTDAAEQRSRFEADNEQRRLLGRQAAAQDARLLAAMQAGLPDCAGVALGVDRLLMIIAGEKRISDVLPFDADRA